MAVDISEATFEREVIERSRTLPVVVDFWAEWCGPCRTLTPALEAAETARAGKVVLAKIDVGANQALAARFGVQGIPAVKAFRDGSVVNEFVGAVPKTKVEELFDSLIPSRADEETREQLRRAVVGILAALSPGDPSAREHRRRLATALY